MDDDARTLARFVAVIALLLGAVALAWFGWIDAPITDGAMVLVAVGLLFAVLAAAAALLALEAGFGAAASSAPALWRRFALALLFAALLVLAVAAVVTLNLRGTADDDAADEATAAHLAVRSATVVAARV